jgi:hypothetical protein
VVDFAGLGLTVNIAIFAVSAICVWIAGRRLAICADETARAGTDSALVLLLYSGGLAILYSMRNVS